VTQRFKKFGHTKVLIGDLAVPKDLAHLVKDDVSEEEEGGDNVDPGVHQWDEAEEKDELTEKAKAHQQRAKEIELSRQKDAVVDVTEENINQFTIDDVVLPVVGHEVRLPANAEMQKILVDIMAEDSISMQTF
jgi:tRNA pseudouridine13 synthase